MEVIILLFYVCLVFGLIPVLWASGKLALWLAHLYGSKSDVYRNGYLHGFADGIKHVDFMRINQDKVR